MHRTTLGLLAVPAVLIGMMLACNTDPTANGDCVDDGDCDGIAVCSARGRCEEVQCTDSSMCGIGSHCVKASHTCEAGCGEATDCPAGETCNGSGQCEPYGCRDTQLDCSYFEVCDTSTGTCNRSPAPHCQLDCNPYSGTCAGGAGACFYDGTGGGAACDAGANNVLSNRNPACGNSAWCIPIETGSACSNDSTCPSGWYCDLVDDPFTKKCHRDECAQTMCQLSCNPTATDPCPRGFACVNYGAGQNYCTADCIWMAEEGYL